MALPTRYANHRLIDSPRMTLSRHPDDQEALIALVRDALAALDRGETVDPTALCAAHPHLAQPLAEVLGLADALPTLHQEALREDPLAGLVLASRYRLEHCLGRGAMGIVYRAVDLELGRSVATKILDARLFRDPAAEQRFAREAEALATLQHPHVVTVFDRGRTPEGIHFLVMELLAGQTLSALLERLGDGEAPLAVAASVGTHETVWTRVAARWAQQLAEALAAAHGQGLVHRDVKPSNAFVGADGRVVLLDFGIAAHANAERLTATQTTLGTPWYMPPEQVHAGGPGAAAPTLDVYGLGATLYHLLAGRPPYQGDAAAVLAQLAHDDPPPLTSLAPDLPRDLVAIVEHCLERDPARRYPTGRQLADDLVAFLAHRPVAVRPLSALQRRVRTWRRAPARPIAVLALLLAGFAAAVAVPLHLERQRSHVAAAKEDLYATLPSLLAIEGWPDERVLVTQENRDAIALLDRILALDDGDLSARLLRALLRLDDGDRQGAAADVQTIAATHPGGYLAELARRYLAADANQPGARAIATADLPEPQTAAECYVAGVHELRGRAGTDYAAKAEALLARAAPELLPARDFRMFALAALAEQVPARSAAYATELYDETVALEQRYGRPTARTQAMRGTALTLLRRYGEAVPFLRRSLELRPDRHGPHQNLGICHRRLHEHAEAARHLAEALRLRPFAWNTRYELAQLALDQRDFAAAEAHAEQLPSQGSSMPAWLRPNLLGLIALQTAIEFRGSDPERARRAAERAAHEFGAALALQPARRQLASQQQLATALQQRDLADATVVYAQSLLAGDPDVARHLANLAFLLPKTLGERETAFVGAVLRRLAARRAGGDEALRRQLEQDLEDLLRPYR